MVDGPLVDGIRSSEFAIADLEGRHRVRLLVDGAANSPFDLGVLRLDRTPPTAAFVSLTPEGGPIVADWIQSDALSGTDPAEPTVVEVNADPGAGTGGAWVPFAQQPDPGDGRRVARTDLAGLPDGLHLVRVRMTDRAGNTSVQNLGTIASDRTAPVVTDLVVARAPDRPTVLAELAFTAVDPAPGVGFVGARPPVVGPVGAGDDVDWATAGASGPGRVAVLLPGPGDHAVTVRVCDRLGNRGESAPPTIHVPTLAEAIDGRVTPPPSPRSGPRNAPGAALAWAYRGVRAFHARRGPRLSARLSVARTPADWRRLLGPADAGRHAGYANLSGEVFIGPAATHSLERLWAERRRRATVARPGASRADVDRITMGLAVLLHETLHATGPAAVADVRGTRSGRAFEEGFTEAATLDLLPRLVADLDLPVSLRARLRAAVGRYRPPTAPS